MPRVRVTDGVFMFYKTKKAFFFFFLMKLASNNVMIDRLLTVCWLSDFPANYKPGQFGRWRNQRCHVLIECVLIGWQVRKASKTPPLVNRLVVSGFPVNHKPGQLSKMSRADGTVLIGWQVKKTSKTRQLPLIHSPIAVITLVSHNYCEIKW